MSQQHFKKETMDVVCGNINGPVTHTVTAYALGGLGAHKWPIGSEGSWNISHVVSGYGLNAPCDTLREAKARILRLLELPIDWNQPRERIRVVMSADGKLLNRVRTIKSGGDTP